MNKKKKLVLTALLTGLLVCGITVAFLIKETETKMNEFTVASVTCEVHEKTDVSNDATNGIQTINTKSSIKVKNTGNVSAYLRVRFVSYWMQEKDGELQVVNKPSVMPDIPLTEGWIKGPDDTYYYKEPVEPKNFTSELLEKEIVLAEEKGYKQVVEIFADAIQSQPTDAVIEAWDVSLDNNNNIEAD